MARRFVRVDLSDTARDFRPLAVEPGVPLLDKSHGNAKILLKWLGGLAAEPEWEGESVNFYVRDEQGGRLEQVHCQLASEEELKGSLRGDVEAVRQRLGKVKPETSTERAVHKIVCASFVDLVDNPNRIDRDNYFFRYRDVQGRWRLVWCWGFQRIDRQPAAPVVCTDPECSLLFVRRPGESLKCPSCEATLAMQPARRRPRWRRVLASLALLLLAVLVLDRVLHRSQLVVVPDQWSGPVGSQAAFKVMTPGLFGWGSRDVSREVVATSDDPKIVRVEGPGAAAIATGPGKTRVRFALGSRSSIAPVEVVAGPVGTPAAVAAAPTGGASGAGDRPASGAAGQVAADSGDSARSGEKGASDATGKTAATGASGMTDATGTRDASGTSGATGTTGASGTSGVSDAGDRAAKPAETAAAAAIDEGLALQDADGKRVDAIEMKVGEQLRLGADLSVFRGSVNSSRECEVSPMRPEVVKFDPETRSLTAVAPGQSPVKFAEGGKSLIAVVEVVAKASIEGKAAEPVADLKIEPAEATIHPGQGLFYKVTGVRGGERRLLGPRDGLRLSTADPTVAKTIGRTAVRGRQLGTTEVVAQVGQQQAKASLTVAAGTGVPVAIVDVLPGVAVIEGLGVDVDYFDLEGVHHVHPRQRLAGSDGEPTADKTADKAPGKEVVKPTESLEIEPRRVSVKVGESTPHFAVSLRGGDGTKRTVDAATESADESILVRDRQDSARFTARGLGRTQVRARYGDRDVFADVTVVGERFAAVKTSITDQGDRDFQVSIDIVAADPETPLEYRAYVAEQTPPERWTPSQQQGGSRRVVFESPRITTGPPSAFYHLILEARDPRDKSIQKYPYTFRLGRTIEEVKEQPTKPPK